MDDRFENDPARMTLLDLVARGHAILAEMNRLSDHIPPVFRMETKEDQQKVRIYQYYFLSLTYFKYRFGYKKSFSLLYDCYSSCLFFCS